MQPDSGPGIRVLAIDASTKSRSSFDYLLRSSWSIGASLAPKCTDINVVIRATSVDDMCNQLVTAAGVGKIRDVQIWGHGSPGAFHIGETAFNSVYLQSSSVFQRLVAANVFVTQGALMWFRTCLTMSGDGGRAFAKRLATALNITVAGHLGVIPTLHNPLTQERLVTLNPGEEPWWIDNTQGCAVGTLCMTLNATHLSNRVK